MLASIYNTVSGTWGPFDVIPVVLRNFGADFLRRSPPERHIGRAREWYRWIGNLSVYCFDDLHPCLAPRSTTGSKTESSGFMHDSLGAWDVSLFKCTFCRYG